jgi:hypothetical protein
LRFIEVEHEYGARGLVVPSPGVSRKLPEYGSPSRHAQ